MVVEQTGELKGHTQNTHARARVRRRRRPRPIATGRGRRLLARAERSGLARTVGFGERDGFAGGGGHGGRGEEKTQHTYKQAYNYSFRNRHTTEK